MHSDGPGVLLDGQAVHFLLAYHHLGSKASQVLSLLTFCFYLELETTPVARDEAT